MFDAEPSGGLDILFACAGGSMTLGPILNAELNGWRATLDLNLVGTMLSIKHAAARMVDAGIPWGSTRPTRRSEAVSRSDRGAARYRAAMARRQS